VLCCEPWHSAAQGATAGQTPANAVVQLNICVSNFTSYEAASSASIRSFFNPMQRGEGAPAAGGAAATVTGGAGHWSAEGGKPQLEGAMRTGAASRAETLGLHSTAQDAVPGVLHSNTSGAVVQRQQLLQEELHVLEDAGAGAGHAAPPSAAATEAGASAPPREDVEMEEAAPVHAPLHAGHPAAGVEHGQQQQQRRHNSRTEPYQPVTKRPSAGSVRQEQQQLSVRSLPQPSVAKHAPPAAGFGSSPPGACIQMSSVLMQLADPEYSSEVAKRDFMAWEAAMGNQ
jgi:hypothetical protein